MTHDDSWVLHVLRNILIVLFSICLLPLSATITLFALTLQQSSALKPPRRSKDGHVHRVLVTGVGMSKGLFLVRTMYLGGCDVIGADFEKPGNLHCGRFSKALRKFVALKSPILRGAEAYISQVLDIINDEQIDLWISCSGVATATEDARLAQAIQKNTKCKVFQFDEKVIDTLDDKLKFMQKTSELELASLQWYALGSRGDSLRVIHDIAHSEHDDVRFMIKSASMDDGSRDSLPLLSLNHLKQARQTLTSLDFSNDRKWILQEFVEGGEEYCTHALVINGKVRAFTACPSASVLLHYRQLNPESILYEKMLKFTQDYVTGLGSITGHMSFDFLVRYRDTRDGYSTSLVPIECNPRCHTATVLFEGLEPMLADVYLEVLNGTKNTDILHSHMRPETGMYWMAHDLVNLVSLFLDLFFARNQRNWGLLTQNILDYLNHILVWRDPTFLWWDPLPWFVLNHLYWPWELLLAIGNGDRWRQLNVSTTKVFKV
ncbi:hypothetical protein K504DRAFT_478022 [Pleomassaria siparia CBS 279.74]|uniref:ATP-grasp domain-containing protein n=1 Tax=Pleomassaria siparia CBS 279.74 TaxID=1314801 RepID=A0A6G1KP14_9PLEO|nr:hypothetical protein K504DRAFT_478022 [Pleomassaria siparia CBS 279.74]